MIFELLRDLADVLAAIPPGHPRGRILTLVDEAIRHDAPFVHRHPTALFQCLWNSCWWYDCPEAECHYDPPDGGWGGEGPPWSRPTLAPWMRGWREVKERTGRFTWLRSLRPPAVPLGGALRVVFTGHRAEVTAVAASPSGHTLASVALWNNTRLIESVRLWDLKGGQDRACFHLDEPGHLGRGLEFSPDGHVLAVTTYGNVSLLNPTTGAELACLRCPESIGASRFSPCAEFLAVATGGEVRLWRYRAGGEWTRAAGHTAPVGALDWSNDSILASGSADGSVRLWDSQGRELVRLEHPKKVTAVAWSKDGLALASGAADGAVRLWDRGGRLIACRPAREPSAEADGDVYELAWSPDGNLLASLYHDGRGGWVRFWDRSCRLVWESRGAARIGWSGDSRLLATIFDSCVKLLDPAGQRQCAPLRGHEGYVRDVAWLPGSHNLVSGSLDTSVRVWDIDRHRELPSVRGHRDQVRGLDWGGGGGFLATGEWGSGPGERVRMFWDGGTGRRLTAEEAERRQIEWEAADVFILPKLRVKAEPRDGETAFVPEGDKEPMAWFPNGLAFESEDSLTWAAASGPEVYLLRLEGWDAGPQVIPWDGA